MDKKDYGYSYDITWQEQAARLYTAARLAYDLAHYTLHATGGSQRAVLNLWHIARQRQQDARRFFDENNGL